MKTSITELDFRKDWLNSLLSFMADEMVRPVNSQRLYYYICLRGFGHFARLTQDDGEFKDALGEINNR